MTDIKNTIHRILNKEATPQDIIVIVRDAMKTILPLVKAYISARRRSRTSPSIRNGSMMQEARNAAMTEYENLRHELLHRREIEWRDIITARELEDMIESEYRNISQEGK